MPSSALANLATYLYFYAAGEVGIDGEDVNYPRIRPMNRHWSELSEAFTPSFVLPLRASSKEGVWESFILSSSSTHPTLSDTFITHIHQVGTFPFEPLEQTCTSMPVIYQSSCLFVVTKKFLLVALFFISQRLRILVLIPIDFRRAEPYHLETINEIIEAAQAGAAVLPLPEYDDPDQESAAPKDNDSSLTMFESVDGFTDFTLDLSCLSASRPSSPVELPASPPPASPPASPDIPDRVPSPRLSPITTTSLVRGSWPMIRYVGRGTPIDRSRRIEWGGGIVGDDVGEDGILFSAVRSSSLDSAVYPSRRSISPDWNYVLPLPSPHSSSQTSESKKAQKDHIQFGLPTDSAADWASSMQSILQPTASGSSSPTPIPNSLDIVHETAELPQERPLSMGTENRTLNTELGIDLGLDEPLDLVLGLGPGINWFESGRASQASPSVYSTPPSTPRVSSSQSISDSSPGSSTTKAEANGNNNPELKSFSKSWWRNFFVRMRRLFRPSRY